MAASFVKQMGNIEFLILSIGAVVFFTLLLVIGNTMAIAVRERTSELAVLKALGYSDRFVLGIVLAESLLLALVGGGAGLGLAKAVQPRGRPHGRHAADLLHTAGQPGHRPGPGRRRRRRRRHHPGGLRDAPPRGRRPSPRMSAIPFAYNVESVRARWASSIVAVLGIAGTVAVFVAMLAMARGFEATLATSGTPENAIVRRRDPRRRWTASCP